MPTKNFLCVYVNIKKNGHKFWVWLPLIALFVLRDAIISFDGWLGLVPGDLGDRVRKGSDALQGLMHALTQSEIDVKVDVGDAHAAVDVRVKTL